MLAGRRQDKYPSFEMLRRAEPADAFRIDCRRRPSAVAIIAPHGGKIEQWTSAIAAAVAADDYSLYRFEGRKRRNNRDLHITSTFFDEPRGLALVSDCDWVVAVHGCDGGERVVYFGGLDCDLRDAIRLGFEASGFKTAMHDNPDLQGIDPRNICNRGRRGRGVQLEISFGLRAALMGAAPQQNVPTLGAFVGAVRAAIKVIAE
jgi:phage replication-related protein YjqB (UPF0714/DUF867 family)